MGPGTRAGAGTRASLGPGRHSRGCCTSPGQGPTSTPTPPPQEPSPSALRTQAPFQGGSWEKEHWPRGSVVGLLAVPSDLPRAKRQLLCGADFALGPPGPAGSWFLWCSPHTLCSSERLPGRHGHLHASRVSPSSLPFPAPTAPAPPPPPPPRVVAPASRCPATHLLGRQRGTWGLAIGRAGV